MWLFERVMMKIVEIWKIVLIIKNDRKNGVYFFNVNMWDLVR